MAHVSVTFNYRGLKIPIRITQCGLAERYNTIKHECSRLLPRSGYVSKQSNWKVPLQLTVLRSCKSPLVTQYARHRVFIVSVTVRTYPPTQIKNVWPPYYILYYQYLNAKSGTSCKRSTREDAWNVRQLLLHYYYAWSQNKCLQEEQYELLQCSDYLVRTGRLEQTPSVRKRAVLMKKN